MEQHDEKQGNRGEILKIHLTRQLFEGSGPQGHFFGKIKKPNFR